MESPESSAPLAVGHASNSQLPKLKPSLPITVAIPDADREHRNGHVNLDTFSPVNQNGSFEYDRVLKSGEAFKRTRKTKACISLFIGFLPTNLTLQQQWKSCYLVLRPNLLSIYKSSAEDRLHKQISLSELNAVAYLKDPKGRRKHVFGLFSPSRNFYLQARDEEDVKEWVELIKLESRIDEEEQGVLIGSPIEVGARGVENIQQEKKDSWDEERLVASSPEPVNLSSRPRTTAGADVNIPGMRRLSAYEMDYSGDDLGPYSDLSDVALPQSISKTISGMTPHLDEQSKLNSGSAPLSNDSNLPYRPGTAPDGSQLSVIPTNQDEARVIWHGYLLCLKSKGGVRQWKKHWVVLRSKNLAFYKSEDVSVSNSNISIRKRQESNYLRRSMLLI